MWLCAGDPCLPLQDLIPTCLSAPLVCGQLLQSCGKISSSPVGGSGEPLVSFIFTGWDSGSGTTLQGGHSARGPAFGEIHGGKRT